MPNLDFSDIIDDPDLGDFFSVIRRTEVVSAATGRSGLTSVQTDNLWGVVTPGDPSNNERGDASQMTSRNLSIVTQFRLVGANASDQPDVVLYDGVYFTVKSVQGYNRFGDGFVKASLESMNAYDPAFT